MTSSQAPALSLSTDSWLHRSFWVLGQRVTILADGSKTGGAFSLIDIFAPPGVPAPPPHFHQDCGESFHVLEGSVEIWLGDQWLPLGPGASAYAPAGVPHTFRNPTDVPARVLSVFSPAGFEQFFYDIGSEISEIDAPPAPVTPEIIERVIRTAGTYGMTILPPTRD